MSNLGGGSCPKPHIISATVQYQCRMQYLYAIHMYLYSLLYLYSKYPLYSFFNALAKESCHHLTAREISYAAFFA